FGAHPATLQLKRQMLLLVWFDHKADCFKLPGEMGKTMTDPDFLNDTFYAKMFAALLKFMFSFNNWQTPEPTPQPTMRTLLPEPFCICLNQQDLSRSDRNGFLGFFKG